MKVHQERGWPNNAEEAIAIQQQLRKQVITTDDFGTVKYVAGVDAAYIEGDSITRAAVVVLSFPDLQVKDSAIATRPTSFPYVPGFLSFREVPAVLNALEKLSIAPDLILCDGQGIAHPHRFGLACHLGVLTEIPTIGAAKTLLIGKHAELPLERGSWQPLIDNGETIGAVLRTQKGVKPMYVSCGHRVSLPSAIDYVLRCAAKYRLPETTRMADRLSR